MKKCMGQRLASERVERRGNETKTETETDLLLLHILLHSLALLLVRQTALAHREKKMGNKINEREEGRFKSGRSDGAKRLNSTENLLVAIFRLS